MTSPGPNLPIVIQQTGDVSRVNDQALRVGEQQQAAATGEVAAEQAKSREQVTKTEAGDAQNRVRADARERRRREQEKRRKKGKGRNSGSDDDKPRPPGPGGVFDVVA